MTVLVAGHPLPPRLLEGDAPDLAAWRARLPGTADQVLRDWGLSAGAPFLPGGSSAWVAPVRTADGRELVLKVAFAHDEARDEALGMRAWQGRGAARLHRSELRDGSTLLLMERVRPGEPLAELLSWPERDEVLAGVAARLWAAPSLLLPGGSAERIRPLAGMCSAWADEAARRARRREAEPSASPEALEPAGAERAATTPEAAGPGGRTPGAAPAPLPADLLAHGLHQLRTLPLEWDGEQVLLATDLHPGNVLRGGTAAEPRWVLIDPKPYVGDPHYDLVQHMLNDPARLAARPRAFAARMAALAGLDPDRLARWLLARCVQEADRMEAARRAALRLAADGVG